MTTTITWYGHATIGIKTNGVSLLVDPFFYGNPQASTTPDKVNADYILITHGHGDHIGDTVSIAKRTGATVICNTEIAGWLSKQGINTHGQQLGGGFQYPFGYLKMTFALHGSTLPDGSDGGNPGGFLLTTLESQKIYLAGDTGLFGDMRLIGEEGLELAMLPIGDNYTMGPKDALRAVKFLNPKMVIPIHFNTFPLIKQDVAAWEIMVAAETKTTVVMLEPGMELTL